MPEARQYIRQGIDEVLQSRGCGAFAIVSNLGIHETDYLPHKNKQYIEQYLDAELSRREKVAYA